MRRQVVAITGASGFVGRHLVERMARDCDVVAIGRSVEDGVPWRGGPAVGRRADLFSLKDAERSLQGVDVAYYLVHSMMPSARLTQASFEDMDAVLADNFGRAAAAAGVRQIIYLGGLMPDVPQLSAHLRSRAEVERLLGSGGVPVTALRAGLVVGPHGSSFRILRRLVERLPILVCPRWTRSNTQPIALDDVVALLAGCAGRTSTFGQVFDVGGPDVLTYRQMIERTAAALGLRRRIVDVPVLTPGLSTLWVSLVTSSSRELVGPLVQSLRYPMVAGDDRLMRALGIEPTGFDASVRDAVAREEGRLLASGAPDPIERREERALSVAPAGALAGVKSEPQAQRTSSAHADGPTQPSVPATSPRRTSPPADVRSIQRLPLPPGHDATDVMQRYVGWLPRFCRPWLKVTVHDGRCRFDLALVNVCLLELRYADDRSDEGRALLYITGGALAVIREGQRGRLEFRVLPDGRSVMAAIHDFTPALPWFVYRWTQAVVHLIVMKAFGRHLRRVAQRRLPPPA